jgi:cold-inducible RNA-binding protein
MAKRIYVGNLSHETTENDLADLFQQVGTVESANIITDRDTGRSKGFGFVELDSRDADRAIAQLHGVELNGRSITLSEELARHQQIETGESSLAGTHGTGKGEND